MKPIAATPGPVSSAARVPAASWSGPVSLRLLVRAVALALVLAVGLLLVRPLGDESASSLRIDTPRYLLNGTFMMDFVRDQGFKAPLRYANEYFARYPGLSLGHHPLLTPIVEAPFLAAFGVSLQSARLSILFTLVVMLVFWFRLIERYYDTPTAFFAALFLASSPSVVGQFQEVQSEPLALCLIVLSMFFLQRYCVWERPRDWIAFIVTTVLSLYAKQLAVLAFPVYALQFTMRFGVRGLVSRRAVVSAGIIGVCAVPLLLMTLKYSQYNVFVVTERIPVAAKVSSRALSLLARAVTVEQVATPVLIVALVSTVMAVMRADARVLPFLGLIGSVFVGLAGAGVRGQRMAFYTVAALCALAAGLIHSGRTGRQRLVCMAVLTIVAVHQVVASSRIRPTGVGGYEAAARFVVEHPSGDSVLYCPAQDNGFFVFFVRKHDPQRQMIVLRADKLLTTSHMGRVDFERVIQRPEEILPILRTFGVGYVVIEDWQYREGPLRWLQETLRGDRFDLRQRIPVATTNRQFAGLAVEIYEYKDRMPANPDARLMMKIPLMADTIAVTFGDLLRNRLPR